MRSPQHRNTAVAVVAHRRCETHESHEHRAPNEVCKRCSSSACTNRMDASRNETRMQAKGSFTERYRRRAVTVRKYSMYYVPILSCSALHVCVAFDLFRPMRGLLLHIKWRWWRSYAQLCLRYLCVNDYVRIVPGAQLVWQLW